MKVTLLILGCTVCSPDMEFALFGIVIFGLWITSYTFDILPPTLPLRIASMVWRASF